MAVNEAGRWSFPRRSGGYPRSEPVYRGMRWNCSDSLVCTFLHPSVLNHDVATKLTEVGINWRSTLALPNNA